MHADAHILTIYAGTSKVPPRVPASGPEPCGGNEVSFNTCSSSILLPILPFGLFACTCVLFSDKVSRNNCMYRYNRNWFRRLFNINLRVCLSQSNNYRRIPILKRK